MLLKKFIGGGDKDGLGKGEKRNRKRMATVAAVYTVERYYRSAEQIMGDEERPERPKIRNKVTVHKRQLSGGRARKTIITKMQPQKAHNSQKIEPEHLRRSSFLCFLCFAYTDVGKGRELGAVAFCGHSVFLITAVHSRC